MSNPASPIAATGLFRAVSGDTSSVVPPQTTWRMPRNVPYLVDNLWEWSRPEDYPSRRTAAFASPREAEARASQPDPTAAQVFRLGLPEGWLVAQLSLADAKFHADVRRLPQLVADALGRAWFSRPLADKGEEVALFCPGLHAAEVEGILARSERLRGLDLRVRIGLWRDTILVDPAVGPLAPSGETFFTVPPDGYRLVPL